MDIFNVFMGAVGNAARLNGEQTGGAERDNLFQSLMEDLRIKADILEHLKGIPPEAVSIAPNVLQKMKESPDTYDFYMEQLDYFVGEYKRCNMPGVMEMSFFIRGDGQYGIRAENTFLKRQCEAAGGGDPSEEKTEEPLEALWEGQPHLPLVDTGMLPLYLAGAWMGAVGQKERRD